MVTSGVHATLAAFALLCATPAPAAPAGDAPAGDASARDASAGDASAGDASARDASARDASAAPADKGSAIAGGEAPRFTRPGWGFGGVPALGFNPDAGLQLGVVANLYQYDGKTAPYKNQIHLLILVSTNLVQHHALALDSIEPFGLPLRFTGEVGFIENLSQNYCGVGPAVTCDDVVAEKEADALGLQKDARDTFLRHYYVFPYIEPYASANLRFRLNPGQKPKLEALAGWRGAQFIPGTIFDDNHDGKLDLFPYPGSLYATDIPGGEAGLLSIFQAGLIWDNRDNEPSPRHGWFVEGLVRGSHPFVGSTWSYAGANVTLRGYTPLLRGNRDLVVAGRLILDGVVGDPPTIELASIGGSTSYAGYGGADLGRGIRGQRYLGRVKVLEQQELRWHFLYFDFLGQQFGLIANAFLDAGFVSLAFDDLGAPSPTLPIGIGGAFLISWNQNFIIRVDVAASSVEGFAPYPYITLGQSF